MKKKILSSLILLVVVFNLLSVVIFAEGAASTVSNAADADPLIAEISANMINESTGKTKFDISKYPKSEKGSPLVIGGYESGIFDDLDSALYFYVYNPSEKEISQIKAGFRVKFILNGETVYNNFLLDHPPIELVNVTTGDCSNRFYKAKIDLSSYAAKYDPKECTDHVLTLDYTMFYYKGESRPVKLDNEIDFTFGIDKTNKKLICDVSNKEVDELEVGMTCYRHGSVDADLHTVNQINTAYFSVPDRYVEYFENIYSIASTYKKKTTVPIMWGQFPTNYIEYDFISADYEEGLVLDSFLGADIIVTNDSFVYEDDFLKKVYNFDNVVVFSIYGTDASYIVPRAYIQDKFEIWQNDGSNKILFVDSEYCSTVRTIDQSFDSLTYDTQADFWERVEDYGLFSALLNHWISGKFSVDEDIYDIPYIVLCDDEVRLDLESLPKESFCYKYFIDEGDYEDFKIYLNSHDNVYLYRFDVSEHWSDVLVAGQKNSCYFDEDKNIKGTFGVCQTAYYDDFQVVNLTFKNEDSYLSAAVTSEPQDFIGPGAVVDGDPDKNEASDLLKQKLEELGAFLAEVKRFVVALVVIVAVVILFVILGNVTGAIGNIRKFFKSKRKK